MSTEFINFLAPPGDAIASYTRTSPAHAQVGAIPSTFIEAMNVRESVFVHEQKVPLKNEFDHDDARSFHWVVYASVSNPSRGGGRKGSQTSTVPVGTIRLVPPPHPPHPKPGSQHLIDNAEGVARDQPVNTATAWHDGKEPYVKIGRLATLKAYRGLGLARLLMDTAMDWASKNEDLILPPLSPAEREAANLRNGGGDLRWKGLILLHAQTAVVDFYKRHGFAVDEEMGSWVEEGITHVAMWRRIPLDESKGRRKS